MKQLTIIFCSIALLLGVTTACGNNNTDGTIIENNTVNQGNKLDTTEDVYPDTMSNDEDFTMELNAKNNENYMASKMDELNFYKLSIEVSYGKNKEYEAEIDQDTDGLIEAEVNDELNNQLLRGRDAFDHIFTRVETLNVSSESAEQEIINQMLQVFGLPNDYELIDIEISFNDGEEINVEDRK